MADNENDNNVISLFEAKKPTLTEITEAGTVGMTGTTGATGATGPTGGWISPKKPLTEWPTKELLTDPIGDLFSGLGIGIFDKINDITASALQSVTELHEALKPYSGDNVETFFKNAQELREYCNSQISVGEDPEEESRRIYEKTLPNIHEVSGDYSGELDNVKFLRHQYLIEARIRELPSNHQRLFCGKACYVIRALANISKGQVSNNYLSLDVEDLMRQFGKKKTKSFKNSKNDFKEQLIAAIKVLDPYVQIGISGYRQNSTINVMLSNQFLITFTEKSITQTFVPWLLKVRGEYEFKIAEKLIAQYSTLNNSEKTKPNYYKIRYKTLFRLFGNPDKLNRHQKLRFHNYIIAAIKSLSKSGYITANWWNGETCMRKNCIPDDHEEAMDCTLHFYIPMFDDYRRSIHDPLPHQNG
jgi:hypothetical protein